ncbi:ParB N-terminal domain-containing protein [Serpentinimonas barnesii]|uniref:ParB N-terminal domain-containing protein n=1 Tax=Serpentinimonas barnesii TaxID=1458427 RepID=UPI0018D4788B|nr:ParB N-terminal domain-containing protein [Serpentinimonas barnesii]
MKQQVLADRIELWPTSRLIPYARNPRKNDHAVDQMAAVIAEFGFRIPIIAKSTAEVVDGHLHLKAALRLGLEQLPVILADDLTPTQIKALRILANRSATWADWDEDLLRLELEELKLDDFDLALTGFDADELLDIMAGDEPNHEGQTDEDVAPEGKRPANPSCRQPISLRPSCPLHFGWTHAHCLRYTTPRCGPQTRSLPCSLQSPDGCCLRRARCWHGRHCQGPRTQCQLAAPLDRTTPTTDPGRRARHTRHRHTRWRHRFQPPATARHWSVPQAMSGCT